MAVLPPTPAVLRSYRLSVYRAGDLELRVGRRMSAYAMGRAKAPVVLLSACNPGGRRMPDGWNRRMMTRLAGRLSRWTVISGEGRLHGWSEALYLVGAPVPPLLALARLFRQNAVIVARPGGVVRLVLL